MRVTRWRAAGIVALLSFSGGMGQAQDVSLTARDGSLSLSGSLQGFDGAFYRIDTSFGLLTVDAEAVICEGPACPDLLAPKAIIHIVGEGRAGAALLPGLLQAFAASRGLTYQPGNPTLLIDPATRNTLADISFIPMTGAAAREALAMGRADLMLGAAQEPGLATREVALDALVPIMAPGDSSAVLECRCRHHRNQYVQFHLHRDGRLSLGGDCV